MTKPDSNDSVLILDQDSNSQALFESFFKRVGFDPIYVDNDESAVTEIQNKQFSLIIVDIFSKGMNQFDTLKKLKKATNNKNNTPIVVITEENKKEVVSECVALGAKDYLAKPINKSVFVSRISRLITLKTQKPKVKSNATKDETKEEQDTNSPTDETPKENNLVEDLIYKLKNDKLDFSTMPQLGYKIIELLKNDNTPLKKVNELIEKDPGIFSRILKSANSAVYAAGRPVYSPKDAIMRIGIKRTINYVLLISSARLFSHPDPTYSTMLKSVLEHSICTAICAREISTEVNYPNPENLFAFGLLHDIGKVLLLRILNQLSKQRDLSDPEMLTNVLAQLHTKFGASLMKKWNFPADFHEAVLCHHEKPNISKHAKPTVITALANTIAKEIDNETIKDNTKIILMLPHNKLIGYRPKNFDDLVKKVTKEKQTLTALLD